MDILSLNRHYESKAIELFARAIIHAKEASIQNTQMTPVIASWNRVMSAEVEILQKINDTVEADNS